MRRIPALLCAATAVLACSAPDEPAADAPPPPAADPPYVPPPESCDAPDLDAPRAFVPCSTGGGIFGRWILDDLGLVAYEYGLDQRADPRAAFFHTEKDADGNPIDRRDHWAAFGNRRVNAMATNDGPIEVVVQDRGVEYLNKLDEAQRNFAGGLGWIDDGERTWSTAYRWRPAGSKTSRRFGMGYAESSILHRDLLVLRRTTAPAGDAAAVVSDVTIENRGAAPRAVRHYEYWDLGRRPIEVEWVVSGDVLAGAPAAARERRDARNALFDEAASWDPAERLLGVRRAWAGSATRLAPDAPSAVDHWPGDPFAVALVGDVADVWVDQDAFFGDGGPAAPAAVVKRLPGAGVVGGAIGPPATTLGQKRLLVLRSDLYLAPGASRRLRFAFGQARAGEPWAIDPAWRDASRDLRAESAAFLRDRLLYFATERDPFLHREMAWHASQLEVAVGRRDYWQGHVLPQGSAYLYLHGADGAARDLGLFTVPAVYTDPALAREELLLYMGLQLGDGTGRFSYAFQGHGKIDDAGIHTAPSDLPLFFLWAVSEYVGATGDVAFLDAPAPFYPREARPGAKVWDHVVEAIRHQIDVVGTGEHGMVRVGTGDWSDGILLGAPDRALAVAKGESVPNTQMAAAVLPRAADLVEARDPKLAAEVRAWAAARAAALPAAWTGSQYVRAWFGDGVPFHASTIDLEAQVWALVGGFLPPAERDALVARIGAELDDPSPAGATLVPGGEVWPAISALLTWGYARSDAERAWRHLARNTLAGHALAFPAIWYGIWSGPDGLASAAGPRPGEAWKSVATPMTDFPVQNANQHALPLLAALRVAGVEATARGLRIDPRVPGRAFALSCALIDLDQRGDLVRGVYRPTGGSPRAVEVVAPGGERVVSALVGGAPVPIPRSARSIAMDCAPAAPCAFEVQTAP